MLETSGVVRPLIESICVFSGSALGNDPAFERDAKEIGRIIALSKSRLIYGGGEIGLMGASSLSAHEHGGKVFGIMPRFLVEREGFPHYGEQILVDDMHERKRRMYEESDAFLVLPGGIGTLEEAVEIMTWRQLGRHQKPVVFLNTNGFWNPFCELIGQMAQSGFINYPGKVVRLEMVAHVDQVLPSMFAQIDSRGLEAANDVDETTRLLAKT